MVFCGKNALDAFKKNKSTKKRSNLFPSFPRTSRFRGTMWWIHEPPFHPGFSVWSSGADLEMLGVKALGFCETSETSTTTNAWNLWWDVTPRAKKLLEPNGETLRIVERLQGFSTPKFLLFANSLIHWTMVWIHEWLDFCWNYLHFLWLPLDPTWVMRSIRIYFGPFRL